MPHIVVEYSCNLQPKLDISALLVDLRQIVVASDLFTPSAVKSRAVAYDDYTLDASDAHFMHVTVSILEGRAQEAREKLADSVFEVLKSLDFAIDKISVNIHEMNRETYRKN